MRHSLPDIGMFSLLLPTFSLSPSLFSGFCAGSLLLSKEMIESQPPSLASAAGGPFCRSSFADRRRQSSPVSCSLSPSSALFRQSHDSRPMLSLSVSLSVIRGSISALSSALTQ